MKWWKGLRGIELGLAIIFVLSFMAFAQAQGNYHIGRLEIYPFASLEQMYDSNIFLEPNESNSHDWITKSTAGLGLKMPLIPGREDDFTMAVRYNVDILNFARFTKENRVDHTASMVADCKFSNDFTLKVEDNYHKTADPPNNELTALDKRYRNSGKVTSGYTREKIAFDFSYENIRDAYNIQKTLNRNEQIFTPTFFYQLFPKTSIFGEYNYGKIDYDNSNTNSNSHYNQWRLGVKGEIAPKLDGVAKFGYRQTDYKQSSNNDFKGFATFLNLTYALKERTTINAYGETTSEESSYSTNSYFTLNKIGFKLDHELMARTFLFGGGYYQLDKYPEETTEDSKTAKRRDYIFDSSIGVRYEIKDWVNCEISYEYKKRDSKFSKFDYLDNKVITRVNFKF